MRGQSSVEPSQWLISTGFWRRIPFIWAGPFDSTARKLVSDWAWQIEISTVAEVRELARELGIPTKASWRRRQLLDSVKAGVAAMQSPSAPAPEPLLPSAPIVGKLARAFIAGAAVIPTDRELALLNTWIEAEFRAIPVLVRFTAADVDLPEMIENLRATGELLISIAHNSHPFLEGFTNAKFRAVHDWHHVVTGADSSFAGELTTFEHAAKHAPKEIRWLLFSEIALQAAACIATGEFQPQKLVRMPGL
jgi:hypothetical protein